MNTIVSVDTNWGIGRNNDLLFHVTEDMQYFKSMTIGKIVIMGENTFYSLPNQKPLKDRINIVLSDKKDLQIDDVTVCNSLDELLKYIEIFNTNDIFIVGGQAIYELMLPYCSVAYVTQFYAEKPADKHFPNLAESPEWQLAERSDPVESKGLIFTFDKYERVK
jgi:dihydrofolate reductase